MNAKNEFEYLVALLQEYIESMRPASKIAVANHAQQCINAVAQELVTLSELQEAAKNESSVEAPQVKSTAESPAS